MLMIVMSNTLGELESPLNKTLRAVKESTL